MHIYIYIYHCLVFSPSVFYLNLVFLLVFHFFVISCLSLNLRLRTVGTAKHISIILDPQKARPALELEKPELEANVSDLHARTSSPEPLNYVKPGGTKKTGSVQTRPTQSQAIFYFLWFLGGNRFLSVFAMFSFNVNPLIMSLRFCPRKAAGGRFPILASSPWRCQCHEHDGNPKTHSKPPSPPADTSVQQLP